MAGDHPDNLRSRAQQRMSRINRRISGLPIPAISNFSKRIHGMTWQAYVSTLDVLICMYRRGADASLFHL